MDSALQRIATKIGARVVTKKAAEKAEPEEQAPKKGAKKAPAKAPKTDPRLAALSKLDPQELFSRIVSKRRGFNVTETTIARLTEADDVETIYQNLEHVSSKQVVSMLTDILNSVKPGWEKNSVILSTEKGVFLVIGSVEKIKQVLVDSAMYVEQQEKAEQEGE